MDKRYQVFISSTFEDLKEERKAVIETILQMRCIPSAMELFTASNEENWNLIKRVIDDSDYFVLIIGGCYGSENSDGKSFTQMEFEYAMSKNKPIISFLHSNPNNIPCGKFEKNQDKQEKLEEFKKCAKLSWSGFWSNPDQLAKQVSTSLHNLINTCPAEGWVRSNSVVDINEFEKLQMENDSFKRSYQEFSENLYRYGLR